MINHSRDTYTLMSHDRPILYLPNLGKTKVDVDSNWLYSRDILTDNISEEDGFLEYEIGIVGIDRDVNADAQLLPTHHATHTSNEYQN